MDEIAFATWVDGIQEYLDTLPRQRYSLGYAGIADHEASLAMAELGRRGYEVNIVPMKSADTDGPVWVGFP